MSQAQQQYGGQKQYMYNASMTLKNQGNDEIKALDIYLLWGLEGKGGYQAMEMGSFEEMISAYLLGGGFQYFLCSPPTWGNDPI